MRLFGKADASLDGAEGIFLIAPPFDLSPDPDGSSSSESSASSNSSSSSSESSWSSGSSASSMSSSSSSSDSSESSWSSSSSSSSSEEATLGQPTITSIILLNGGYQGKVILRFKAFVLNIETLASDTEVRLFVNGDDAGIGVRQPDGVGVLFYQIVMPIGAVTLTVQQEREGEVSDMSPPFTAHVNTEQNLVLRIPKPELWAYGNPLPPYPSMVGFRNAVALTIKAIPGADIYYCVDGTGYSQPTIKYRGPILIRQTSVIKTKAVFRKIRSFVPLESAVLKRTIQVIR